MSKLGISMVWAVLRDGSLEAPSDEGVDDRMLRGQARRAWRFVKKHYADFGQLPHKDTVLVECDIDEDLEFEVEEPAAYYARRVVERAALNNQKEAARDLRDAFVERDPYAAHESAKAIVQVGMNELNVARGRVSNQRDNSQSRWERYLRLESLEGGVMGFSSPWPTMDSETGGWRDGALITVVARLGLGKTWASVINQVCCERQGARVGFVSPEMSVESLELRRDAVRYQLPYRDLLRGELDHDAREQYYEALMREATEEFAVDSFVAAEGYISSVVDAEIFAQEREIDILFVDGMYLLHPPGDNGRMPWHERVMHVVRGLKEMALKLKIPVFATGQFNRSVRTGSMRAGTESIGHTDAIGQFSDIVIGMFQDDTMRLGNQMSLRLLKNREGRPIELLVNWDLIRMDFSEIGEPGAGGGAGGFGGDDDYVDQETMF